MKLLTLALPKKGNLQEANKQISKLPPLGWLTFTKAIIESVEDAPNEDGLSEIEVTTPIQKNAEEKVLKLLTQNPTISGATFMNLLKSRGIKFTESKESTPKIAMKFFEISLPKKKAAKKEADSGSTMVAVTRESFKLDRPEITFRMQEAKENGVGPTKFKVILITEGLGNMRDAYWYTRGALESAIPLFEGRKCYANHPSQSEESERPERDVRDILGHFSNVHIEEGEDGRAQLVSDLTVPSSESFKWARDLIFSSIEYRKEFPDKDLVGLSINANGSAEQISVKDLISRGIPESCKPKLDQAIDRGIRSVKLVIKITDAVSCDLVTEAGAGGKIISVIE